MGGAGRGRKLIGRNPAGWSGQFFVFVAPRQFSFLSSPANFIIGSADFPFQRVSLRVLLVPTLGAGRIDWQEAVNLIVGWCGRFLFCPSSIF